MLTVKRPPDQAGSALMLVPACVLILLLLAGLAIDSAGVYFEQRQLNDAASSLANQIASRAIDVQRYYSSDGRDIVFDTAKVNELTADAQSRFGNGYLNNVHFDDPVVSGTHVSVHVSGSVKHIIASQLPGGANRSSVEASAQADLLQHN